MQYRDLLQARCHFGECLEVLLRVLTAYPAEQTHLKASTQTASPLLGVKRCLARNHRLRLRLTIGRKVQHQQGAFGKQWAATHRSQVIEQGQQHQSQIAAAGQYALDIGRQLHQRSHERLKAIAMWATARRTGNQEASGLLHFFGK